MTAQHKVVSHDEWIEARKRLLAKEKEFTRARDVLSQQRRDLPWERVEKTYVFEGAGGQETLADLFAGKSQLIVYHFMFDPAWDAGCKSCSFWADNFDGIDVHLAHRDVSFIAISRAPYGKLAAYKRRMGWRFKWMSSFENDFNYDYHVSFTAEEVAKGAIVQPTKSMAIELACHNIQVNAIAPGWIETDMTAVVRSSPMNDAILARTPANRWGKSEEIIGAAMFLASRGADFVTGVTLSVDGSYSIF